jgi:hypothetical protein
MEHRSTEYVPESLVAACAATAMMLVYSAPTPGTGSRYLDGRVAHESKALSVLPVRDALAWSGRRGVGEETGVAQQSGQPQGAETHATTAKGLTAGQGRVRNAIPEDSVPKRQGKKKEDSAGTDWRCSESGCPQRGHIIGGPGIPID